MYESICPTHLVKLDKVGYAVYQKSSWLDSMCKIFMTNFFFPTADIFSLSKTLSLVLCESNKMSL